MADIEDNYARRVLFDPDGEGLDFTDMNDMQLLLQAQLFDNFMVSGLMDAVGDPANPTTAVSDPECSTEWPLLGISYDSVVLAPYAGCGFVRPTGVANQVACQPGPLLVITDEPFNATGETTALIRLPNATLTTGVGDATEGRIDLIEIGPTTGGVYYQDGDGETRHFEDATTRAPSSQSTDKRRSVNWTIQVKAGTPSATPAYPTPTAGFRPLAAIYVAALHNAVHLPVRIRDHRFPLGRVDAYDVPGYQVSIYQAGGNPWTIPGTGPATAAAASDVNDPVYAFCPVGHKTGRLVGVGIFGRKGSVGTCELVRTSVDGSGSTTHTPIADLGALWTTSYGFRYFNATALMDELHAEANPGTGGGVMFTGTRVPNTHVGTPVWLNGYAGGPVVAGVAGGAVEAPHTRLAVKITGDVVSAVHFVRFYVASGL